MGPGTSFSLVRVVKLHARVPNRSSPVVDECPKPEIAATPPAGALVIPGASVVVRTPSAEHITSNNIRLCRFRQVHDGGVYVSHEMVYPALGLMPISSPSGLVPGFLVASPAEAVMICSDV